MNALTAWLEKYLLPIAGKIGSQRHLVALRDSFIGTMPATMAGSIAVMINAIIRDLPKQFFPPTYTDEAKNVLVSGYDGTLIPVIKEIISINGYVWNGTIAVCGLIFAFSWGYYLSKMHGVNDLAGGIVSVAALIQGINWAPTAAVNVPKGLLNDKAIEALTAAGSAVTNFDKIDPATKAVEHFDTVTNGTWGWLNYNHLNGNAYFTVMIIGFVAVTIYATLMKKNITIKLPDSVPPAVSKAFAAIIPATAGLFAVGAFNWAFGKLMGGQLFIDWIQNTIAKPLLGVSQGLGPVLIVTFLIQLLWFFGIHGPNVLAPILEGVWGQAQLINIDRFQKGYGGQEGTKAVLAAIKDGEGYMWVRGSFDAYAWFGGSGGTIVLIIAILLFSKRADYLAVGRLALGPGIFNINEPIMFGLPIVLNAIMFIPFLVAPLICTTIGYLATSAGLVSPVSQSITWVVPPVLLAFMATGADWRAALLSLLCMVVAFFIWTPFVIAANKMDPNAGEVE